ncbi:MAG: PQQ-binding-like beta-propeller repeat protein [Acidobacteriota bacterium]
MSPTPFAKTSPHDDSSTPPLRLWPGLVLVALLLGLRFGLPALSAELVPVGFIGGLVAGLLTLVWWLGFSRAPQADRWIAAAVLVGALLVTPSILHPSLSDAMMGLGFYFFGVPTALLALVLSVVATRRLDAGPRRLLTAAAIILGCLGWALVRSAGITGAAESQLTWRWTQTAEQRLLAASEDSGVSTTATSLPGVEKSGAPTEITWAAFRGPGRDGAVHGSSIGADWQAAPPLEVWRRAVGPGWSSFAVAGDLVLTQEQRGDDEIVSAYDLRSGAPVWTHSDAIRFWESNAGAGPRATPTIADGRVYSLGATGRLNVLDLRDGSLVWSRDAAADVGAALDAPGASVEVPMWGFSGSPLVLPGALEERADGEIGEDSLVVVAVGGTLAAYDADGALLWVGSDGGVEAYSSPQRVVLDGVEQILLVGVGGLASFDRAGKLLWRHEWSGAPIVQPAALADGELLLAVDARSGLRRLAVHRDGDQWQADERWTSRGLKPYFNDFVVHEGHAYGFDGRILAAIDLDTGERVWKGGRYGNGQLLLLADQDLLLVLSETGELALVAAHPDGFEELARRPALEGKTWNHPVLVGDTVLVRNDREMAAFRLAGTHG